MNKSLTVGGKTGLTKNRVQELIIAHKAPIRAGTVLALAEEFSLSEDDVDQIIATRSEYSASPAKMRTLLLAGFTVDNVNSLYDARDRINTSLPTEAGAITIAKLLVLHDTFPGANCDADSLNEIVSLIYEAARVKRPDISIGSALMMTCRVARSWNVAMLETALEIVRKNGISSEGE